jgi:hypothetical protein
MAFTRSGVRLPLAPPTFAAFGRFGWQANLREGIAANSNREGREGCPS